MESLGNVCLFYWPAPVFFNKINLIWLEGRQDNSISWDLGGGAGAQDYC